MGLRTLFTKIKSWIRRTWRKLTSIVVALGTTIGAVFLFLASIGAITILGHSGDVMCAGTPSDPCYAYINFTVEKNVLIDMDDTTPYGMDTTFEFAPEVASWRLQYLEGDGWTDFPSTGFFNLVKGNDYQIRMVVLKNNPRDHIVWSFFDEKIKGEWIIYSGAGSLSEDYTVDLVSCWSFDSDATDDYSDNDGSVTGATHNTTAQHIGGGAYTYNGTNDYITIPTTDFDFATDEPFTINFWAEQFDNAEHNSYYIFRGSDTSPFISWGVTSGWYTGMKFRIVNDTADEVTTGTYDYSVDELHMWTAVFNTTHMQLYKDGVADTAVEFHGTIPYDGNTLRFGQHSISMIDEMTVWGRALVAAEITELFNTGTGTTCDEIISSGVINVSVPYFNNFETNSTAWTSVYSTSNICTPATTGSPALPYAFNRTDAASGYYSSATNTMFGPEYSAHSYSNLTSPEFILNGNDVLINFTIRVKQEINYDGTMIYYRYNGTGEFAQVLNDSTTGVYFKDMPYTTYKGYGGHGTSTTSCAAYAFSNQDTGLITINLSSAQNTGTVEIQFRDYADTNTVCSSAPCGIWIDDFQVSETIEQVWWNESYTKCKNVTVVNPSDAETDFPVPVNITYESDMQIDFDDIRFVDEACNYGGDLLYAELEEKTDSTNAYTWVKTSLDATNTTIGMYYGNAGASANWDSSGNVWDDDYIGVWHTSETSGTRYDSTSYGNNATTAGSPTAATGMFDGGLSIDGTGNGLDVAGMTKSAAALTAELWTKPESADGSNFQRWMCLGAAYNINEWCLYSRYGSAGESIDFSINNHATDFIRTGTLNRDDAWHYIAATYNAGAYAVYLGSELQASGSGWAATMGTVDTELGLGNENDQGSDVESDFDEFRVSKVARSASWLNISYQLIVDPASFIVYGSEESAPVSDTCTYTSGDWTVLCSDDCSITSAVAIDSGNNITITGTGTFSTTKNITGFTNLRITGTDSSNRCVVTCSEGGCFNQ